MTHWLHIHTYRSERMALRAVSALRCATREARVVETPDGWRVDVLAHEAVP